jgi:hypothetical protein
VTRDTLAYMDAQHEKRSTALAVETTASFMSRPQMTRLSEAQMSRVLYELAHTFRRIVRLCPPKHLLRELMGWQGLSRHVEPAIDNEPQYHLHGFSLSLHHLMTEVFLDLDSYQDRRHDSVGDVEMGLLVVSEVQDLARVVFELFQGVPIDHNALLDQVLDREEG